MYSYGSCMGHLAWRVCRCSATTWSRVGITTSTLSNEKNGRSPEGAPAVLLFLFLSW